MGQSLERRGQHLDLLPAVESARDFATKARAENTRRSYASDFSHFKQWCFDHRLESLPATPETVAVYLSDGATRLGLKPSTLARRIVSIRHMHRLAGHDDPTRHPGVGEVWKGIRRELTEAPDQKVAITVAQLRQMLSAIPETKRGHRDGALLLIGFAGGFRRSELVAINVGDLRFEPDGLTITVRRSKTDPTGRGRAVGIALGHDRLTCPVRNLERWMAAGGIDRGPLFRRMHRGDIVGSDRLRPASVATVVKAAAAAVGLDPAFLAGHSLRSGFVTAAARSNQPEWAIMRQTGHRSHATLRRYIQGATALRDSPSGHLGL
ncbi:MAG: tyrosine-type recombinase/integrase [Acidimicrobiales bacterium]|nr:tyrosine-type recombinase/integrase [Acidimicrobiales bacterium]